MYYIQILLFLCFVYDSSVWKKTLLTWKIASRKPSVCTMYIMISANYGTNLRAAVTLKFESPYHWI
jgi:uncharacterized membrane protein